MVHYKLYKKFKFVYGSDSQDGHHHMIFKTWLNQGNIFMQITNAVIENPRLLLLQYCSINIDRSENY
jgi:hypothetical protein